MARPRTQGPCKAAEVHRAKTHCPKGHPYDEANTYHFGPGKRWRACKACHVERARKWQIRRGAAQALAYF